MSSHVPAVSSGGRIALAGALEFPQPFAECLGKVWKLLPAKEKHGNKENEQ